VTGQPPVQPIKGPGPYRIHVRLEPVAHVPSRSHIPEAFDAVDLVGADFKGEHDRGLSRFEARVYAPPGVEDSDRDRCMIANFGFHHMVLDYASGGNMHFTGVLVSALAYTPTLYQSLDSGVPLTELESARGNWPGDVRYLPPPWAYLQPFLGWRAAVTIAPLRSEREENQ
jgi:hypothetical protein